MLQNCVESPEEIEQVPGRDDSERSPVADPESPCAPAGEGSLQSSSPQPSQWSPLC